MTYCSLCPRISYRRPIPPDGPIPCKICLLGEAPSSEEDDRGIPFCGKTGFELDNTYLPLLGLPRSEVLICNSTWCSQPTYQNPTNAQAFSCSSVHLAPLLVKAKPLILVPMGAVAASLFPFIRLSQDHGIPFVGEWGSWRGCVYPVQHPSAGIHQTSFMCSLMDDFYRLGKLLRTLECM